MVEQRMRFAWGAAAFVAAGLMPLGAEARPDTRKMTCQQTQALVDRQGAITLSTGEFTYARFVSGTAQCRPLGVARAQYAPTSDNRNCRLQVCRSFRSSDGTR